MAFFTKVKTSTRAFLEREKEKARDKREFNKKLQERTKIARREAFLEEAENQAKIKARKDAIIKFNPPKPKKQPTNIYGESFDIFSITKPKKKGKKKLRDPIQDMIDRY